MQALLVSWLVVMVTWMGTSPAAGADETFHFTRERFDEMAGQMDKARDLEALEGDGMAWNQAYVLRAYLDMYQATEDRGYLRRFVALADGILAVRDDALGRQDYAGRSRPLWGIAGNYTMATATLRDDRNRDALAIRSIRYAYNNQTRVTIERGTEPSTWRLSHGNKYWEKLNRGRQTFDNLSLDPKSPRYVEAVVNHPDYVADRDFSRKLAEAPSFLLVVTDLRADAVPEQKTLRPVRDIPLVAHRVGYQGYIGPIYSPMTRFASLVERDQSLQADFGQAAQRYISAAEESLATWESCWRNGPGEGEGYYLLIPKGEPFWCDGVGAPLNYLGAVGQVLLDLHDLTGKPAYRDKAHRIGRLFKNELELRDNGAYVWQYWWGSGKNGWTKADALSDNTPAYSPAKYDEDMSHAAWEVEFAVQAYRRGIVFNEEDMGRLAATFTKNLWVPESNDLTDRVNGDRNQKGTHNIAGGGWLELCEFDPRIFDIMHRIFAVHRYDEKTGYGHDKKEPYGHLAAMYARLYRRQKQLAK